VVQITSPQFKENAARAIGDAGLQKALGKAKGAFLQRRGDAVARLPEFEQLRDIGRDIKNHTLANLDFYLETYAANVEAAGGTVHWCSTAEEARAAVLEICRKAGAKTVTKGKSMISEELGINDHLEAHGIEPVETDLGEYIIQLRREHPSHIIAPAFHLNREDWENSFREMHTDLPRDRVFSERRDILTEARTKLRDRFLAADVGITGANGICDGFQCCAVFGDVFRQAVTLTLCAATVSNPSIVAAGYRRKPHLNLRARDDGRVAQRDRFSCRGVDDDIADIVSLATPVGAVDDLTDERRLLLDELP
jgi:hypothetical protein